MGYMNARLGYDPYMGAASTYKVPEKDYLSDLEDERANNSKVLKKGFEDYQQEFVVPQTQAAPVEKAQGVNMGQVAQDGATGAAMGGPMGAAIGAGGSFLTQYIAQRAADERAKRQAIGAAYQNQASNEQNIINSIMASNARALR